MRKAPVRLLFGHECLHAAHVRLLDLPAPTCLYSSRNCQARSCSWSATAATSSWTASPKGRRAASIARSACGCCCCCGCALVVAAGSLGGRGDPEAALLGARDGEREVPAPCTFSARPEAAGPAEGCAAACSQPPLPSLSGALPAAAAASGAATPSVGIEQGPGVGGAATGICTVAAAAALDSPSGASGCSTPADRLRPRVEQRPARAW